MFAFLHFPILKEKHWIVLSKITTEHSYLITVHIRFSTLTYSSDILRGLHHLLQAFAATSPTTVLTPETVRFWHRDLKPDQIVIEGSSKTFYLVDFGISQVEYKRGIYTEKVESHSTTGYEADLIKILLPLANLVHHLQFLKL